MKSEEAIKQATRLFAAQLNITAWRNNVGACTDVNGRLVRYGLANDSAQMNKAMKSSDLIGITPMLIRPEHVGRVFGVFTAIETKHEGWKQTPSDEHAAAQAKFHAIVRDAGGFAGFVSDPWQIFGIIRC